jgi:hypothetical protein
MLQCRAVVLLIVLLFTTYAAALPAIVFVEGMNSSS